MKYLIFLFLLVSCETNVSKKPSTVIINGVSFSIYEIENCEYLGNDLSHRNAVLTHKGNCKNPIHYENTKNKEGR